MSSGGITTILISVFTVLVLSILPLPESLSVARPAFAAMIVAYWVLNQPRRFGMLAAWLLGLFLDVVHASLLGQHALGLILVAYIIFKLRETLRMFPGWQQAVVLLPVWAIYELVLFWIDGFAGLATEPMWRWVPVLSTTLAWPILTLILHLSQSDRRHA